MLLKQRILLADKMMKENPDVSISDFVNKCAEIDQAQIRHAYSLHKAHENNWRSPLKINKAS